MAKLKILFFVTLWLYTSSAIDTSDKAVAEVLSHIVEELGELRKQNAAMESEINELKRRDAQHSGRIAVLEAREKELTGEIDELKTQSGKTKNRDFADQAAAVDTNIKHEGEDFSLAKDPERVHEMDGAKRTTKNQNHIRRQLPQEMPVAFFATLTNHASHLGTHQSVAFDHVITNVGNAYHNSTGVFTAPVPGVYVFSVTILATRETAHFYFVVNGQSKSSMYVNAADVYETTSQTAIFNLKKGDDVFIQNGDLDKLVHGNHYSSLSGFLLSLNSNEMTSQVIG